MSIPILGQASASPVHPQARLNILDDVAKVIAETKQLGLQHGRAILKTPADKTSVEFMVFLDGLLEAGCTLVALTEHPAQAPDGTVGLQVHLVFRLSREQAQ